jgi:hypothetical protein
VGILGVLMSDITKQYFAINLNPIAIFMLIVIGVITDNDFYAILAAAYWLWLPNIEKCEFSILRINLKR